MPIINSMITSGIQPSGTKSIVANGTYDVTDYASADVQVPTTAPDYYYEYSVNNGTVSKPYFAFNFNGITTVDNSAFYSLYSSKAIPSSTVIDMSSITSIFPSGCYGMFQNCVGNFSVNLSGLTTINSYGCYQMFSSCRVSVDLSGLTTISSDYACHRMFSSVNGTVIMNNLTSISGLNACNEMFFSATISNNIDLSHITSISGMNACNAMFNGCVGQTIADLSNLTTINGSSACASMFRNCNTLTSVDLSNLTTVNGSGACYYMFCGCANLTSVYLPKLVSPDLTSRQTQFNEAFMGATSTTGVKIVDLRNLKYCGNYGVLDCMFDGSVIEEINLNALEHIGYQGARAAFAGNYSQNPASLSDVYFPMLTSLDNQAFYSNGFVSRKNLTIHFRKDMQTTVEGLYGYSSLWSAGSGCSAVFDLAGTLTGADGNAYTRSEKDSVYASETAGAAKTATAWNYNNTIYYTSGGTEPQVGDTIYSDSACTTAITTIDSIA